MPIVLVIKAMLINHFGDTQNNHTEYLALRIPCSIGLTKM